MKKIRFYAPMYLLAAGLAFTSPSMTVHAEEEEEEVLYEEEEENYQLEDIEDNSEKTPEQIAAEEQAEKEREAQAAAEAEKARQEAEAIEAEKASQEAIIGSTEIDTEDQVYNTGRDSIPDSVQTEAERKGINKIPEQPEQPGQPDQPGQPGQPGQPNDSSTTPSDTIVIPVSPKTGIDFKRLAMGGAGIGLAAAGVSVAFGVAKESSAENKVVGSKKKYRKRKNKKRSR